MAFLDSVSKGINWSYIPAMGIKGGSLVGLKSQVFEVVSWQPFKFCAMVVVNNLRGNFIWRLIVVYGSAYDEHKMEFLEELHSVIGLWQGATLLGGDFNMVRSQRDKSKGAINFQMTSAFNNFINCWGLIQLKDPSRSFTWSNNQVNPILEVLNRALVNVEWNSRYPLSNLKILPREISDHNPIRISFGEPSSNSEHVFRFEKWWLDTEGFEDLVKKV
jgi:hypothetical protein